MQRTGQGSGGKDWAIWHLRAFLLFFSFPRSCVPPQTAPTLWIRNQLHREAAEGG